MSANAKPITLQDALHYDVHIHAHVFCEVCGIRPATLRQVRYRARRAGRPDPLGARSVSASRVLVSLRDALPWLQETGRDMAILRLAEWLQQREQQARRDMYQVQSRALTLHSISVR